MGNRSKEGELKKGKRWVCCSIENYKSYKLYSLISDGAPPLSLITP